jgi:hypothetical protein
MGRRGQSEVGNRVTRWSVPGCRQLQTCRGRTGPGRSRSLWHNALPATVRSGAWCSIRPPGCRWRWAELTASFRTGSAKPCTPAIAAVDGRAAPPRPPGPRYTTWWPGTLAGAQTLITAYCSVPFIMALSTKDSLPTNDGGSSSTPTRATSTSGGPTANPMSSAPADLTVRRGQGPTPHHTGSNCVHLRTSVARGRLDCRNRLSSPRLPVDITPGPPVW